MTCLLFPPPNRWMRASLLLAMLLWASQRPLLLAQDPFDPWQRLANVWNPFAQKMNGGVIDLAAWKKVVKEVDRIENRSCR